MAHTSSPEILTILRRCTLFRGLDDSALPHIRDRAKEYTIPANDFFFHEGEPADACYVILSGRVRLCQTTLAGQEVIAHILGPGRGLAIIAVLEESIYPLSAQAMEDTALLAWNSAEMAQLMEQYPKIAINGLRLVANRMQEIQARYRELATERVERRIARTLLRLAQQFGRKDGEGSIVIDTILSREAIAQLTGTTHYSVSRTLSKWEQSGLVETGREAVTILSARKMVAIAEDLPNNLPQDTE
jgi:CRP-like cAMP-binding protein